MTEEFDGGRFVDAAAIAIGLAIAPDYRPGVVANFARIAAMARLILDFELDENDEPAPVFRP